MDELGEERGGALLSESGKARYAVRIVPREREQIRDARGSDSTPAPEAVLVEDQLAAPVHLHDVGAAQALAQILVGGEDADLVHLGPEAGRAGRERIVR